MRNIIDKEELNNKLEKILMYKNEESITFDSIQENLNKYNHLYNTSNQKKIISLNQNLYNKLNTIKLIHENYIKVINQNITKYEEVTKKVELIFSNIER